MYAERHVGNARGSLVAGDLVDFAEKLSARQSPGVHAILDDVMCEALARKDDAGLGTPLAQAIVDRLQ